MPIKVEIKSEEDKVKVILHRKKQQPLEITIPFSLAIRRTIDGEILILDHPEIDISILPAKMKVIVFPKEHLDADSYGYADQLFKYLHKKRVIKPESIKSGNVYGSLEATIRESKSDDMDSIQLALMSVALYIQKEKDYLDYTKEVKREMEKRLFEPKDEESTDLGDVPHAEFKGSIVPGLVRRYGQGFYYIYEGKNRK